MPPLQEPQQCRNHRRSERHDCRRRTQRQPQSQGHRLGLGMARHVDAPAKMVAAQPRDAWMMSVSEWDLPIAGRGQDRRLANMPFRRLAPDRGPRVLGTGQGGRHENRRQGAVEQLLGTVGRALSAGDGPGGPALPQPGQAGRGRHDAQLEPGRLSLAEPGDRQPFQPHTDARGGRRAGRLRP